MAGRPGAGPVGGPVGGPPEPRPPLLWTCPLCSHPNGNVLWVGWLFFSFSSLVVVGYPIWSTLPAGGF